MPTFERLVHWAVAALAVATAGVTGVAKHPIDWHKCGNALDTIHAQCAEIAVPLDYRKPGGRTITIALSRVRATDPAHRRGALLINPGGPGRPGLEQVALGASMPDVAARYDLIGMDPRFVGQSTPLHCRWNTDTYLRSAGPDRRSFDDSVRFVRSLAAGCTGKDRDLLPYASTRDTARDMDAIRAALGEPTLSYFGVSYGSYLGAVYLQMFGGHADRFVLDSAVDPDAYGPGLLARSGPAAAAALRSWAAWAAGRSTLGATTDDVLATVDRISLAAAQRPLAVGPYRIDGHVLPYLLFAELGSEYPDITADVEVLDAAGRGASAVPSALFGGFLAGLFTGSGEADDRAGTPILCADRAVSGDPATYFRDIQAHRGDEPLFGPLTRNISPCAFWPTAPAEPPTVIHNSVPVLVVGADGDPYTPYAGQQTMHRALSGSRLVTLRGAFRHGVYLAARSTCVDGTVDRYFTVGALPAHDGTCGS